jgi:hypothetical protein
MPALAVNTVNPDDADFDHTGERMFRAYALCPMRRDRYPGPWGVHPAHATRSMRGKWRATPTAQITGRTDISLGNPDARICTDPWFLGQEASR